MNSNDAYNNNSAKDLDFDLVQMPEEMRQFIIAKNKKNPGNFPPPPEVFYYSKLNKNPTVFPTRQNPIGCSIIGSPYSLLISLCDPTSLVLTIQKQLKNIININKLTYCDSDKQWKFSYGKPQHYLKSQHQIALYHAAVRASEKFPPKNLDVDDDDIIRISEYKNLLLNDCSVYKRLPHAFFNLTLRYNPEQTNIIMELLNYRGDSGSHLTANFIKEQLNAALISAGFIVNEFEKDKPTFKM